MELYETVSLQDCAYILPSLEQKFKLSVDIGSPSSFTKELEELSALSDAISFLPPLEERFKLSKVVTTESEFSIGICETVELKDFVSVEGLFSEVVSLTDKYRLKPLRIVRREYPSLGDVLYAEGYHLPHYLLIQDILATISHVPCGGELSVGDLLVTLRRQFEEVVLEDRLYLDGVIPSLYTERFALSDNLAKEKVCFLHLAEEASLSSLRDEVHVFREETRILDKIKPQPILEGTYKLSGKVFIYGTYEPIENAVVHIISVEPRQNITYTRTDECGYYLFLGVPPGEYLLVALKEGYTVSIARLIIDSDYRQDFILYPLDPLFTIEKIYNKHGNIVKLYALYDEVDDFGYRVVTCIIFFGDLYGTCHSSYDFLPGYVEPASENTTISLEDFFNLGKQGLFDYDEEIHEEDNKIVFYFRTPPGDIDGFIFKIRFPASITGKLKLVLGEGEPSGLPPSIPSPDSPYKDIPEPGDVYYDNPNGETWRSDRGRPRRDRGSWGGPGESNPSADVPSPGLLPSPPEHPYYSHEPPAEDLVVTEEISLSYIPPPPYIHLSETLRTRASLPPDFKPLPPIPTFSHSESEELELSEIVVPIYTPPPPSPPRIFLSEKIRLSDSPPIPRPTTSIRLPQIVEIRDEFAELKWITVIGRCIDIYGNPVPYANVFVYELINCIERLFLTTKADEDGFYIFSVPAYMRYRVKWTARGLSLVEGIICAGDKDIVEERARIAMESESLVESGDTFFYETIFVFSALSPVEGGKIYGYVYDSRTLEKIEGAVITARKGEEQYADISDENGYYEITVPRGKYTLTAEKPGYRKKEYSVEISSNWHQDIYLDPVVMTIYVYDAVDSKPKPKPIANARVVSSAGEYYTDENGVAQIYVTPGETVRIEKAKYKTLEIEAVEGERTVFMHPAYRYLRLDERVRLR